MKQQDLSVQFLEAARFMFRDDEALQYSLQLYASRNNHYAKWQMTELQVLRNDVRRQAQGTAYALQMAVLDLRQWFRRFVKAAEFAC